ncbi:hypothetical protein EGW08_023022 [Elysia chlorotica]|uniref:Protein kinase domain-containing protein n=1 Tax=Elysia chlorotica TaxID=188477 RepID=A0A3S1GZH0_ELYCH|nr:hypothetical protein EGW08_023022 [Elysia chlorotica]
MAQPVNTEKYTIHKIGDEDFYKKYNLKKVKLLGEGMAGKVYLVKPRSGPGKLQAVKEFSFSRDVIERKDEDFYKKYNLKKVKLLGEGMAGKVYLVKPRSGPGKLQAVKEFSFSRDVVERSMKQFTTEARVMQAASHPHLVPCTLAAYCYEYGAIAMPYYPQGDLVLKGKQDPGRVHRLISQVARAVEYLHKRSVAHNDIKLENVFVDGSGRAHLGDMGLLLHVTDGSGTAVASEVGGTEDYWAPEIMEAGPDDKIDPFKCDVYALGVMYWALVTDQDFEAGTNFLGRLQVAEGVDLSTSQSQKTYRISGGKNDEHEVIEAGPHDKIDPFKSMFTLPGPPSPPCCRGEPAETPSFKDCPRGSPMLQALLSLAPFVFSVKALPPYPAVDKQPSDIFQ